MKFEQKNYFFGQKVLLFCCFFCVCVNKALEYFKILSFDLIKKKKKFLKRPEIISARILFTKFFIRKPENYNLGNSFRLKIQINFITNIYM